ncbi:MAG: hypothetical protein HY360_24195 [Verrucomicrobia bacterium]|nr:hypothetical protein [Verrucomicrobiota bacterium]
MTTIIRFVGGLVGLLVSNTGFSQCSMCKTALVNSSEGQRLSSGMNDGIIFLLVMPFVLVGMVALRIFYAHRRRNMPTEQKGRTKALAISLEKWPLRALHVSGVPPVFAGVVGADDFRSIKP